MTEAIYEFPMWEQFDLVTQLADEAHEYFGVIDGEDEPAVRHLIRYFLVPKYVAASPPVQEHARRALLWFMYCATEDDQLWLFGQPAFDWPTRLPDPISRFFEWWWEEIFHEPPPPPTDDLCEAEYLDGYPPEWKEWEHNPPPELDHDVVLFPRRDGNPPGHGAPEVLRDLTPPPPPTRPTDAARFFTWQDQAEALDRAQVVHAESGQHKVWVEFQHIVGEGYLIGGQEYRQTNWACVRFRDGLPVDSWPELRRGWRVEQ